MTAVFLILCIAMIAKSLFAVAVSGGGSKLAPGLGARGFARMLGRILAK